MTAFPSDPIIPRNPMPNATTPSAPGTLADDEAKRDARLSEISAEMREIEKQSGRAFGLRLSTLTERHQTLQQEYGKLALERDRQRRPHIYATTNAVQPQAVDVTGEAGEPCHICGYDCAGANPPVMNCPMQYRPATRPAASGDAGGAVERLRADLDQAMEAYRSQQRVSDRFLSERNAAEAALASMTAERDRLAEATERFNEAASQMVTAIANFPAHLVGEEMDPVYHANMHLRAALASPQADAGDRG